jgi:hypothetical protein
MVRLHISEYLPYRGVVESCGIGYYLGQLPTSGISEWTEVRAITRLYARLFQHSSTGITAHMTSSRQAVDPGIESIRKVYILIYLGVRVFVVTGGVGDNLGNLASRDIHIRPEVRGVLRIAWLVVTAARIT